MKFVQYLKFQLLIICLCSSAFSQIESGKVTPIPTKKETKKHKKSSEDITLLLLPLKTTYLYAGGLVGLSTRNMKENPNLFGKPLGERASETSTIVGGFTVGVRTKLKANWNIDFGLSLAKNGESYAYQSEISDSSYAYSTTYTYFGIPLKINYTLGNRFQFMGAIGIQPQLFMGYKQAIEWTDEANVSVKSTISSQPNLNTFTLASVAQCGINVKIKHDFSVYLMPEFRYQLTNSYQKQSAYIHHGIVYGVHVGLALGIN